MRLTEVLQQLNQRGITIVAKDGSIAIHAPTGALTSSLRSLLVEHKAGLIAWLEDHRGEAPDLPQCVPNERARNEPFPMSDLQLGFFMADDPYMEFHVRPHYYCENDYTDLNVSAYEVAWNKTLQRHRAELAKVRPDGMLELVGEPAPIELVVYDLRNISDRAEVERALLEVRAKMERSELRLDRWPWLDLRVSSWNEDGVTKSRVHYNHNNFFTDGYGTMRLLQEVRRNYADPSLTLPPLALSYRDAVLAIEGLAEQPQGIAARQYWERRLPNLPGPPELPVRAGMNRRCRSRLQRREHHIAPQRWAAFQARARAFGLTTSCAMFAAYAEILVAWSNNRHFVLSNMMTRRLGVHPEMNSILGQFASLYPLEIDYRDRAPFVTRALRVQGQVDRDAQHRAWGGMRVMQALSRLRGGFGQSPIPFVVGSGVFMTDFPRADYSCLETSQVMLDHQFWEQPDGGCYLVYDVLEEFFPAGLIDALVEAHMSLLAALATRDEVWHSEACEVIPPAQLEARRAVEPPGRTFPALRLERLQSEPRSARNVAVVTPSGEWTYEDLEARSERIAAGLRRAGVQPGDVVGVLASRGPTLVACVHGVLKAGAAYVPVDPALPEDRRSYLLENAASRHLICEEDSLAPGPWPAGVEVLRAAALEQSASTFVTTPHAPDALAYVIYTSGSTGRPKGVMIEHRAAANTILDIHARFDVTARDVLFGVSSFSFDLSVYDLFGASAASARLLYPSPADSLNPSHWLDLMQAHGATIWNSAPALATLLVETAEFRGTTLPSLRLALLSGDWIPLDLPDRFRAIAPNARIVSLGGATEAAIWSILYEIDQVDAAWSSIPYGYPMTNQRWFVLDSWGRPAPEWTPGELYIGGAGLARGYVNAPEQTAAAFATHPHTGERIYRTGDLGRYLPGGAIEFLGRRDSQVKIQGQRVELGEIEAVVVEYPGISAAIVSFQKDAVGRGGHLVAYLVLDPGARVDHEAVQTHCSRKLPAHMVPRALQELARLPLNSNGKIDRNALPPVGFTTQPTTRTGEPREPSDEVEAKLLEIWRRVLGREQLCVEDDFFEVGGQSIEGVRIIGLIRELFGASLSLGDIWHARTVEALARRLRKGGRAESGCIVELAKRDAGVPMYWVHPAGGHVLCYRALATEVARSVIAFQAPGTDGRTPTLQTIPQYAELYARELETTYPEGPLILAGWSSGGVIAFEMAARLRSQGRDVRGLVILDSPAPLVQAPVDDSVLFRWFLSDLELAPDVRSTLDALPLDGQSEADSIASVAGVLRRSHAGIDDELQLAALYRVFKSIVRACRDYAPPQLDVDILLVRATTGSVSEFARHPRTHTPDWGWGELTERPVDTVTVDGTHYSLLSPPAVHRVAAAIERRFGRAAVH